MAAKGIPANVVITGMTGSGKTTITESLLAASPRILVFDYYQDYEEKDGLITEDVSEAIDYLLANKEAEKFRLVFRDQSEENCMHVLRFASAMQFESHQKKATLTLTIVFEEAWRFSEPGRPLDKTMHVLFTAARRWRVLIVSVSQRDVNMHPTIRAMSQVHIAFRGMKLSDDTKQIFGKDAERIFSLPLMEWPTPPKRGVNYLQMPADVEVQAWWRKALQ